MPTGIPVVNGTVPDVLRWVIYKLQESSKVESASLTHPEIMIGESVTFWKGGNRFWESVSKFASKLFISGRFENVLHAMECYPSSVLVFARFVPLFAKYKRLGTKKIHSLLWWSDGSRRQAVGVQGY